MCYLHFGLAVAVAELRRRTSHYPHVNNVYVFFFVGPEPGISIHAFTERTLPWQNIRAELAACWFRAQAIRCQFNIDENQVAEGFPKPQTHLRSATSRQVSFGVRMLVVCV